MENISVDINRVDESGYDLCYLAMQDRNERLALSILKDKRFDRYHLNDDKTLLSQAIYFGCEDVVDVLLEDKQMVQLANRANPYYELEYALTKKPDFLFYMDSYHRILDKLLKKEEIDFSKAVDACMYFIAERHIKKRASVYPELPNYIPYLSFYDEAIVKILEQERLAKCEISPNRGFGCKSLLYYILMYGKDKEFETIMKSGIDINKQFAQDEISNKLYYENDERSRDEWLVENALTVTLGCDEFYPVANQEDMDFDKFYALIFNQKLDSKYVLEAINRICYSKLPLKEELIIKILANRDWPQEDIYNKTLLSFAFYGMSKAYRFFLSNPNVDISTLTLELIHEYARKFHQEEYEPEYNKIEKNEEQEKDIDELTMQLLMTRQDCISEEEMLPYYLLIRDFCNYSDDEFTKNIIEKFQNQKLVDEIIQDSWWKIKDETKVKIRPRTNLPSYRIDHIDKFILQDNEKNKELVAWAKNYTDKLIQEASYLPNQTERGKRKEKTVTTP